MDRVIRRKHHIATFRGIHNSAKAKTLIVLHDRLFTQGITTGLTVAQLYLVSGVNYDTLRSRLGKWHTWGYVSRQAKAGVMGKPTYYYTLGARGKHFVEDIIPERVLRRYIAEIRAWRSTGSNVKTPIKVNGGVRQ